jgi:peptidyl-prolyl cis-trans isomerase SurA
MFGWLRPLTFALLLAAAAGPAAAQTKIVAKVNGDPITSYEVAQRARLLQITGTKGDVAKQAIDELIDEKVQTRAARMSGVGAPEADVDRAVAEIASRVKMTPPQLAVALGQAGVNIEALRARLRAQIAFNRLVRNKFQQTQQVTEQELVHMLRKDPERPTSIETVEYDLTQVIVALPTPPTPERIASAMKTADGLRAGFTTCAEGLAKAKATRNVVVRPYGRRTASELSPDARQALATVEVGHLAPPLPGPRGLVLFAVCDKKTMQSTNAAMKEIEPEVTSQRGEAFTKQYTRQLRRDAVIERL